MSHWVQIGDMALLDAPPKVLAALRAKTDPTWVVTGAVAGADGASCSRCGAALRAGDRVVVAYDAVAIVDYVIAGVQFRSRGRARHGACPAAAETDAVAPPDGAP